jgi:hypothetical protein
MKSPLLSELRQSLSLLIGSALVLSLYVGVGLLAVRFLG